MHLTTAEVGLAGIAGTVVAGAITPWLDRRRSREERSAIRADQLRVMYRDYLRQIRRFPYITTAYFGLEEQARRPIVLEAGEQIADAEADLILNAPAPVRQAVEELRRKMGPFQKEMQARDAPGKSAIDLVWEVYDEVLRPEVERVALLMVPEDERG